jgi:AraC-like DNA-binding protein
MESLDIDSALSSALAQQLSASRRPGRATTLGMRQGGGRCVTTSTLGSELGVLPSRGNNVMTVSIHMVRALVGAMEPIVGDRGRWLAAADLDPRQLEDCGARLSLAAFEGVKRVALAVSGDEALGLHMLSPTRFVSFDVLADLTSHAATLRESLEAVTRYARIYSEGVTFTLSESHNSAVIRIDMRRSSEAGFRMSAELAMSGMLYLTRRFVGAHAQPRRVCFPYEAPTYRAEYRRVFGGAERFGQPFTGIELKRSWLKCTQLYNNPELCQTLTEQAERELGRVTRSSRFATRVTEHLAAGDPATLPNMENVARRFGISARSLRRRLHDEDITYNVLVERALATLAKRMLAAADGSIQATAYRMGFSTPSGFHRAFKRWTGLTPKQYMRSC